MQDASTPRLTRPRNLRHSHRAKRPSSPYWDRQMRAVLVGVLIADHLQNVAVRFQKFGDLYRDWLDEYVRVVNRQLQVHMAEIAAMKALLDMQGFGAGISAQRGLAVVIETCRVHHQRIAFPSAHGVAEPCRLRIFGKLAPIQVYLTVRVIDLVQDHDLSGRLNDLEGSIGEDVGAGDTERQTLVPRRIIGG